MKQQTPIFGGRVPKHDDAAKRALAEAIQLHAAGRYDDALAAMTAAGVLKTATGQSIAGDIHVKRGNRREALRAFDNAARLAPTAAEPHANRGAVLLDLGRLEEALAAEDRALRLRPDYAAAHFNRGNVLRALRRFDDAAAAYTRALRADQGFAAAYVNRALTLLALGRSREALEDCERALRARPTYAGAHVARAMAYRDMGQFDQAFASIDAALAGEPDNREALQFRCDLLYANEQYAESLAAADALLAQNADDAIALGERGRALQKLRRLPEALAAADRFAALAPNDGEAHVTRAAILAELGRHAESIAAVDEARRLGAAEKSYLPVQALARSLRGDPAEALADFERAIAADPHAAQTYYNRSYLRLALGDWRGGWADHEWRLKQRAHVHNTFAKLAPQWAGEPLAGKRLLLYGEQGLGDMIQFVRYVRRFENLEAAITLIVPEALQRLFADNFPAIEVIQFVGLRNSFDYQASLMSLPALMDDTIESMPGKAPYLGADPKRTEKWAGRIGRQGFRVGIIWQGSRDYARDAHRSIPLATYAPLAAVSGVRLISVQAKIGLEQLDALPAGMKVERLGEELENNPDGFREMAAAMANLDLLVMSDTGPTHLAAALGRPVWLALDRYADWRWMREREDTPWYPNMRLFRQRNEGDWDEVFARIAADLAAALARRK